MDRSYYVYILTNKTNCALYIGVTNDLVRRIYEHKEKLIDGFTSRYRLTKLVYFECFDDIVEAIAREKAIKGWIRKKKVELIGATNPGWCDLYEEL